MSVSLVAPFHLAVVINYSLFHRVIQNHSEAKSLVSLFLKDIESKIKAQYLPDHVLIEEDNNISIFDKLIYKEIEENYNYDEDLSSTENFNFLARFLCTSNFQALEARNGDDYTENMNLELITQIVIDNRKKAYMKAKELSFLQFIKLVDNVNYQCSAMNNYSNSLCKLLLDSLVYNTIRIQPEYSEMDWSLVE